MGSRARLTGNGLLDALPEADRGRIEPVLRRSVLATRQVVIEPNRLIETLYFPLTGVISLVTPTDDGSSVHVASVGAEGMVGIPVVLGEPSTPNLRAIVTVPGVALSMPASQFRRCLLQSASLHAELDRYASALLTQAAQEVACNRRHSVLERCSCWLLLAADRTRSSEFPMTQEFLAELLGTRRASVVAGAGALQKAGAIHCRRGRIAIADRHALEAFTCGCYRVIRETLVPA